MFKKKQTPSTARNPSIGPRRVSQSPQAPVFSYYANRTPEREVTDKRGETVTPKQRSFSISLHKVLSYVPSLAVLVVLAVCLVYMSTLSYDPVVQVAGHVPTDKTLVTDFSSYQGDLRKMLGESAFNHSKLFIDTDKLAKETSDRFPELGDVSVVLPLVSRRPVFKIYPAQPAIVLSAAGGPYVVDVKGRVLAYTKDTDSSLIDHLPTIIDESGLPVERGSGVLTTQTINFVDQITGQLAAANIPVESLKLPPANAGELDVKLAGKNYFVKFDMRGEGRQQVGTLIAVKQRLEQQGKNPGQYVDVRVPGKAFYK